MKKKNKKLLGIFGIALVLNTIENLILLSFFSVPIAQNSIIGSLVFASAFTWIYHQLGI